MTDDMKIFYQLRKVMDLEARAHTLFDDACSNLAYGHLSREMRNGYVHKTYEATRLHHEAMETLRAMAAELNAILGTGYHLD